MLEFILVMLLILGVAILGLIATSIFLAYVTQAQYIDENEFGDNDDD